MTLILTLIFFHLSFPVFPNSSEEIIQKAVAKKIYESRQWERLLHLEKGIFGKKSEADDQNFFTSPESVDDPKKELMHFLKLIVEEELSSSEKSVICRFPARSKWIKKELSLPDKFFNFSKCIQYNQFINSNVKKNQTISLVFSSYYLESPASAFGHTFFRIKNKDKSIFEENPNELLDTGISYAANMTTDNALMYAVLGMAGGFYGAYSLLPYYYKIREYNDFESRDLWSFDLNLSDEQIHFLLDHLWELGHTKFRYFYFTENCSYELLRLLEATDPNLKLVEKIPFYIIPVDTIKAVYRSDLVTRVEFRPSTKRKLDFFLSQLDKSEKNALFQLIESKEADSSELSSLNDKSQVKVLDTLMQYLDFKYAKDILNQKGPNFEWKGRVLEKRATYSQRGVDEIIPLPKEESPHLGHDSTRAGLFFGSGEKGGNYGEFHYRFAMHDVLDPSLGHPPHANLEFFDVKLRYFERLKKVVIQDWTFVDVMTLNPWNDYQRPTSLKANIGLRRKPLPECFGCLALNTEIGGGVTKKVDKTTFYFLGETDTSYSGELRTNNFELAFGPSFNLLQGWGESMKSLLQLKYFYYLSSKRDAVIYDFEHRYHLKNEISLSYHFNVWRSHFQHQLGIYYFF